MIDVSFNILLDVSTRLLIATAISPISSFEEMATRFVKSLLSIISFMISLNLLIGFTMVPFIISIVIRSKIIAIAIISTVCNNIVQNHHHFLLL